MTTGSRLFLAHAHEDKSQVRKLYADLKARGFDPWLDEIDLVPGQIWKVEIPKALRHAEMFLACLSRKSVESAAMSKGNSDRRSRPSQSGRPGRST